MTKKGRKLILVRKDLLEKAASITAKEGRTMFAFTNEIFENAIKAHDMETTLEEIIELYSYIVLGKTVGLAILPSALIDYMLNELYRSDTEDLMAEARKSGVWFGKSLLVKFSKERVLNILQELIKKYIWHSLDLSITERDETVDLRCISPTLSQEKTQVISEFIKGAFDALNYKLVKDNCFRGIISMTFRLSSTKPSVEEDKIGSDSSIQVYVSTE